MNINKNEDNELLSAKKDVDTSDDEGFQIDFDPTTKPTSEQNTQIKKGVANIKAAKKNMIITDNVREAFDWVESIAFAIIAILVIFTFFMRVTSVDGKSMLPTLKDQDKLLITNFLYTPNYNDVIVLKASNLQNENGEMGKPLVKRIIGLPGDTIEIDFEKGVVYRNDEPLKLETLDGQIIEDGHYINTLTTLPEDMTGKVTVPSESVFVMGDNRNHSMDSRSAFVGMIDKSYIVGKVFLRIAPLNTFGGIN